MNKIIKIVLITGLLPLISGCSGAFEDRPAKMFELTLNDGTATKAIKCSRSATESPAENAGNAAKGILDFLAKIISPSLRIISPGVSPEAKKFDDNEMMALAFIICNDITLKQEKKKKEEKKK